jgi:hypothetical protein
MTSTTVNGPKDTTFTKIFVGGLPYHTTDQSLREFFEQFGGIDEAVVITDRNTGKSKGYGFVTMSDKLAAERACEDPNPIIDGRKANVNLAYLGAKPRTFQATFPYAFQNLSAGLLPSQSGLGIPQIQYVLTPAGYVATMPGGLQSLTSQASATNSAASVAAATALAQGQMLEYATSTGYPSAAQLQGLSFDVTQQASTARYMNPASAYYTYTPQLIGRGTPQFPQLQERMQ